MNAPDQSKDLKTGMNSKAGTIFSMLGLVLLSLSAFLHLNLIPSLHHAATNKNFGGGSGWGYGEAFTLSFAPMVLFVTSALTATTLFAASKRRPGGLVQYLKWFSVIVLIFDMFVGPYFDHLNNLPK